MALHLTWSRREWDGMGMLLGLFFFFIPSSVRYGQNTGNYMAMHRPQSISDNAALLLYLRYKVMTIVSLESCLPSIIV